MTDERLPTSPTQPHELRDEDERSYTLDDLTSEAGVTVRTVRYYISEGLLPPPHGAGPGTRYTQQHLDRLLLIGALKDAYLPLKEIRRRIGAMTEEEIQKAKEQLRGWVGAMTEEKIQKAKEQLRFRSGVPPDQDTNRDAVASTMPMASPGSEGSSQSSAAAYIEAVLRQESQGGVIRQPFVPRPRHSDERSHRPMRFPGAQQPVEPPDVDPAHWRRLAISPEAELLIEESVFQRRREQIEALVAWARRILDPT